MAILELAAVVEPGVLKESTLSRQLRRRNLTKKALEKEPGAFRRFEAEYRNACWQGDVQHTLYLPHPEQPGKKKMAYLVVFMDDTSRYVFGQFYFEEKLPRLEDCFKKALLRLGIPEHVYVDNGSIYSARHFARICVLDGKISGVETAAPLSKYFMELFPAGQTYSARNRDIYNYYRPASKKTGNC